MEPDDYAQDAARRLSLTNVCLCVRTCRLTSPLIRSADYVALNRQDETADGSAARPVTCIYSHKRRILWLQCRVLSLEKILLLDCALVGAHLNLLIYPLPGSPSRFSA